MVHNIIFFQNKLPLYLFSFKLDRTLSNTRDKMKPTLGLKHNVTAVVTDDELAAFKKLQQQRGGSMASLAREGVLMLLQNSGHLPTDIKKAS